jgi:hypothetical protein
MSIGSDRFVAKRFFEIGSDEEVTAPENKKFLEDELIRLKTAAWFFEKFKVFAKERAVEFSSGKHLICLFTKLPQQLNRLFLFRNISF